VKRRDLIRELRRLAGEFGVEFELVRHGAEHDQFRVGQLLVPIPRHRDINEMTARGILRSVHREFHEDRAWKEE
jgi:mRNA interferase HicA